MFSCKMIELFETWAALRQVTNGDLPKNVKTDRLQVILASSEKLFSEKE